MRAPGDKPALRREVSRWQIVSLSINDVIGSGVYLLPAAAAVFLGPASLLAVPAAGLAVLLIVLCFAEAASHFDSPGSAYLYTRTAFGDFIGFEVGWMTWLTRVTVLASLSAGFAQATTGIWAGAAEGLGRVLTIVVPLLVLTAINVLGVRYGARTAVFLVIAKIVPLAFLIVIGIFAIDWAWIVPMPVPAIGGLGEAALLLLFAYAGFENTAAPAGEFKNPRRDVPFALLVMITSVTSIYLLIQLIALGVVPELAASATPLADAAGILAGPFGIWLLTVGAMLSILGTNNNTVLSGSRYLYALADARRLPAVFADVHPRYHTPWIALVTQTAIALPLALTGSFVELAALSVISRMATYMGTAAAVPVLRRKLPSTPSTIRLPGGPAIPLAALLVCVVLLSSATAKNLILAAVALIVGAVIYVIARAGAQVPSSKR